VIDGEGIDRLVVFEIGRTQTDEQRRAEQDENQNDAEPGGTACGR
jgi:hypothetical protein